jgi:hypothetical protein
MSLCVPMATTPTTKPEAPFRKGQWVARLNERQPLFGTIRDVYLCDMDLVWVMDVVVYSPQGDRVGRASPPEGGPTTYEPALPCSQFQRIQTPNFPIKRDSWSGAYFLTPHGQSRTSSPDGFPEATDD